MPIRIKNISNKGYIIAEAAIIVPIFLFACVLLIYMVRIVCIQEIVHFEASRNLVVMAADFNDKDKEISESNYESVVNEDVSKSMTSEMKVDAEIEEMDNVYKVDLRYPINLRMPFGLVDDIEIRDVLVARKWNGGYTRGEVLGFDAMARDDSDQYVFVFPKYGERYHEGGCRYLYLFENGYIKCVTITEAVSEGFTSCQVCH